MLKCLWNISQTQARLEFWTQGLLTAIYTIYLSWFPNQMLYYKYVQSPTLAQTHNETLRLAPFPDELREMTIVYNSTGFVLCPCMYYYYVSGHVTQNTHTHNKHTNTHARTNTHTHTHTGTYFVNNDNEFWFSPDLRYRDNTGVP